MYIIIVYFGDGLHSEIVPEVEKWLANTSKKGQ